MKLIQATPDLFYSTIIGKRIVCFGAGKMPVDAIKALQIRDYVDYFYDNGANKWNTLVGVQGKRYEVHNPAEMKDLDNTGQIVILITNRDHYSEIADQIDKNKNLEQMEVFIYPQFDLKEVYSFQKTEKYEEMQKYWKSIELGKKERQLELGVRLVNYVFDENKFFTKQMADLAMQLGERRTALRLYAKLVDANYTKEKIVEFLQSEFTFDINEQNEMYRKNLGLLNKYPFFYGDQVDNNSNSWIYFREGNSIFPYHSIKQRFAHEIIVGEPQSAFCHIEDDGNPVFVRNEYNEYVLIYLAYTVRDSEKYGADNHIYLYYDDINEFYNYLYFVDFSILTKRNQFVFLIGRENENLYPLQIFSNRINEPEMLQIEEMQHICIMISNGFCGSSFFTGIISASRYVVGNEDKEIYYFSNLPENFHDILQDTKRKYSYKEIVSVLESNINGITLPMDDKPFNEYVSFFKETYIQEDTFNIADLWKVYFIAKYYLDGGRKDTRFVPCIFWDIHNGKRQAYFNMLKEFAMVDYFAPVRNPIVKLVRCYDRNAFGVTCENHYDDLGGRFMSGFNQKYSYPDAFEHKYVVAKFEDCKLYPKEMFQKICYTLCIPYDETILEAEARDNEVYEGEHTKGFDLAPLNRRIDHVFSAFDRFRLELFYSQINEHYGYEYYDFSEQPITDEEVEMLFDKPFRFEDRLFDRCYTRVEEDKEWTRKFHFANTDLTAKKIWFDNKEELRATLKNLLIKGYRISRYEKIRFPFFIRKSIQGTDLEEIYLYL